MKINIYVLTRNIVWLNAANVVNGTDNNVVKLCQIEHSSIYYLQNFNCRRILTLLVSFFIINSIFSVYICIHRHYSEENRHPHKSFLSETNKLWHKVCSAASADDEVWVGRRGAAEGRKAGSEVRREREELWGDYFTVGAVPVTW